MIDKKMTLVDVTTKEFIGGEIVGSCFQEGEKSHQIRESRVGRNY